MKISTPFHNNDLLNIFYTKYSENRYENTNSNYISVFIPFKKSYINILETNTSNIFDCENLDFIKELMLQTLKINRLDINSYYQDHTNTPTVRSLHSTFFILVVNNIAFYYDRYNHDISRASDELSNKFCFDRKKIYLIGLSDILNLSRYYSDFSFYPSLLEGGHMIENIINVINKFGISSRFKSVQSKILDGLFLDSRYCYTQYIIELDTNGEFIHEFMSIKSYIQDERINIEHNELEDTKYLKHLIDFFNNKPISFSKKILNEVPKEFIWNRNSAHNTIGNYNINETFSLFNIEAAFREIESQNDVNKNIDIYILELKEAEYIIHKKSGKKTIKNIYNYKNLILTNRNFFDVSSYRYIVLLTSPRSDNEINTKLFACGQIMQRFSMYTARLGYAFRPMKNHNDHFIKNLINLKENTDINYMGVVCNSNSIPINLQIN